MELLSVLLPYLGAGIMVALVSRFTGIATSLLMAPTLLYWGATPGEFISFMLTFILYNTFTQETEHIRLELKELTFFPGWKIAIPVAIAVALVFVSPELSVGLFLLTFIMELIARIYKTALPGDRPEPKALVSTSIIAIVTTVVGILLVQFVPASLYFIAVGLAMLALTAFAWYAAKNRYAMHGNWGSIWGAIHICLGLFGLEISSYARNLHRAVKHKLDGFLPVATLLAAFFGAMTVFTVYKEFSLLSLVSAIGCSLGIRFFGSYQHTKTGQFSYIVIGLTVLIVLVLFLTNPDPHGLVDVRAIINATAAE